MNSDQRNMPPLLPIFTLCYLQEYVNCMQFGVCN